MQGQTTGRLASRKEVAKGTLRWLALRVVVVHCLQKPTENSLQFIFQRSSDVAAETGVGRPALGIVHSGFRETESSIDSQGDVAGIFIVLPVVFPPTNGAQQERARHFERAATATRAAIRRILH